MFLHPNDIVVHGTCRGADVRAGHHARRMGHKIIEVAPDWVRKGRSAALIRNRQIVDMKPRMLIAFPGGKGTAHAKKLAVKAGIPVIEIVGKPDEPIDVKGLFGDE